MVEVIVSTVFCLKKLISFSFLLTQSTFLKKNLKQSHSHTRIMRRKNSPPPPACRDRGNRQLFCWFYFLLWFWWLKRNSWKTNSNEKFTNSDWRKGVGQGWVLSVSLILGRPGNKLKVPRLDFRSNNLVCVPGVREGLFFFFSVTDSLSWEDSTVVWTAWTGETHWA